MKKIEILDLEKKDDDNEWQYLLDEDRKARLNKAHQYRRGGKL